jgi:alpha-glucosidase/alpha-D-xyloside xylohydrolase
MRQAAVGVGTPVNNGPLENNQNVDPDELHYPGSRTALSECIWKLRYRLLPYNYSMAREACDTGPADDARAVVALSARPGSGETWQRVSLGQGYPGCSCCGKRSSLAVESICQQGNWYDWWTGEKFEGQRWIERKVDLSTLPLYVRAGAILPLDPVRQYTAEQCERATVLRIYPGADGTFTFYDDDGRTLGYRDGSDPSTTWIRYDAGRCERHLALEADHERRKQCDSNVPG